MKKKNISEDFTNISISSGTNNGSGKSTISYVGLKATPLQVGDSKTWTIINSSYNLYRTAADGYYKIEVWGAKGGTGYQNGTAMAGGSGGYTVGYVNLSKDRDLYVYLGGTGGNGSGATGGAGGYNGGAKGGNDNNDDNNDAAGGGGGATDVRYGGTALDNRIIVAGGGGGGSYGSVGGAGNIDSDSTNSSGNLGTGQAGFTSSSGSGGGGGGYYGGKSVQSASGKGFGGTYYISEDLLKTNIISGANSGAGKATITYVGETLPE